MVELADAGASLGSKLGFWRSTLYTGAVIAYVSVSYAIDPPASVDPLAANHPSAFVIGTMVICGTGTGFLFGIFPSLFIGSLTGACIGSGLTRVKHPSAKVALLIGGVISAFGAMLINSLLWQIFRVRAIELGYLLWWGIPSLIYILASSWIGWKLYKHQATGKIETPLDKNPTAPLPN